MPWPKHFTIDPTHISEQVVVKRIGRFDGRTDLTNEELMQVLDGSDYVGSTTSSEAHPGFIGLRKMLHEQGYINMETRWVNGDSVIKPFALNGFMFLPRDQFPCASVLRWQLLGRRGGGGSSMFDF